MIGTLVDSNDILDLLTEEEKRLDWSEQALSEAAEAGPLVINPVIYAEISVRFRSVEDLDEAIPSNDYLRAALPWSAAFLAGKAFVDYRRRGGTRTSTLPDFFIGAHAAAGDLTLLTRDVARYRTYFPTVRLIAP